jgi:Cu(I)/Ag(I) efflux system membrane protein CusA/SilA
MPQQRSSFAERISQGFYVNVDVDRDEAARYGLSVADVQTAVSSGIGGRNIAENIEGRERYPINVRYEQDFRDSVDRMRSVLIGTPSGSQIPLGQVARVSFSNGPAMIRDEDGQLTGYIYINLKRYELRCFCRCGKSNAARSKLLCPPTTRLPGQGNINSSSGRSNG